MKKIFSLFTLFLMLMLWGVQAKAVPSTNPADYPVAVMSTDLKTWPSTAPAVGATTGTFAITGGNMILNGAAWMHATRPQITTAADTVNKRYLRFGTDPTFAADSLPTNYYVDFINTTAFYNGGIITAEVSTNSMNVPIVVYGVYGTKSVRLAIINCGTSKQMNIVSVALPDTVNGLRTLRFVRKSSGPYLWSISVKTNQYVAPSTTVIKTDMKDLHNVVGGASPVVQASSGTFNLTTGQLTLSGPTWMRNDANTPQIAGATVADTAGLRWVRFGTDPTITNGLPTTNYIDFENSAVPYVTGGTITAILSSNSASRTIDVYGVYGTSGVKLASLSCDPSQKLDTVSVALPDTISGIRKLRFVRSGGTPFLWKLTVTTKIASVVEVTATPGSVDLSSAQGDGASKDVTIKGNSATTGSLALAMKNVTPVFTLSANSITEADAKAGKAVTVTLPITVLAGTYTDTLLVTGGGLTKTVKVPVSAVVGPVDVTPPTPQKYSPAQSATNVIVTTPIYVVFNEKVQVAVAGSITVNNVAVASTAITSGATGDTLKLTPATAIAGGQNYTVKIAAGAIKDKSAAQNATTADITWTFTTDGTAPTVRKSTPAEAATGVAINARPSVTFSEKVKLVTTTATLMPGSISATLAMGGGDTVITVTPASNLAYLTPYTLTVPANSVADLSGNAYASDFVLHFTTKKQVTGLFYTDFSSEPAAIDVVAPAVGGANVTLTNPQTVGNIVFAGHGSMSLQGRTIGTPINAASAGGSNGNFASGGNLGSVQLPAIQGPCMIYFYHSPSGAQSNARGWTLTANGTNLGSNEISGAGFTYGTTPDNATYRMDSALYTGADMVTFKLTSTGNMYIFDILVTAVVVDNVAPVIAFNPANGTTAPTSTMIKLASSKKMYKKDAAGVALTSADLDNYVTLTKGATAVSSSLYTKYLNAGGDTITLKLNGTNHWDAGASYTVTLDSVANSWFYKSAKQSATFTTTDDVFATGVSINNKFDELKVGETKTLTATVNPSNATNKSVTWSVQSGSQYVTFNATTATVKGLAGSGSAQVKIRATANGGTNVYEDMTFYVVEGTGVNKAESYGITVMPNPTSDILYVKSPIALKQVKVYATSTGSLVYTQQLSGGEYSVNLNSVAPGSYIVVLYPVNGKPAAVQVVKQ